MLDIGADIHLQLRDGSTVGLHRFMIQAHTPNLITYLTSQDKLDLKIDTFNINQKLDLHWLLDIWKWCHNFCAIRCLLLVWQTHAWVVEMEITWTTLFHDQEGN